MFYVPDTKSRGDWHVVQSVEHRHIWDSSFFANLSEEAGSNIHNNEGDVYQQNDCPIEVDDIKKIEALQLNREDEDPEIIEIQRGISSWFIWMDRVDFVNDENVEDIREVDAINDIDKEFDSCSDANEAD